jgi:DNA-binding LacI/PurR family transcriptional regulator
MPVRPYKYKEVETEIRQLAATLPPGAKIPPERHLAVACNCSFLTVRKALQALVADGTIIRKVGHGTFVNDRHNPPPPKPPQKKPQVGLLVHHLSDAYAQRTLLALARIASQDNVELRSTWVEDFEAGAIHQAKAFAAGGCAAIVLPWFPHHLTREVAAFVRQSPLPVSIPLLIPGLEKNYFRDPAQFGASLLHFTRDLCVYFEKLGRPQVAFLGPATPQDAVLQKMLSAYACHMAQAGLPTSIGLAGRNSEDMDRLALRWKKHTGGLAIISYDDQYALRFLTAMHKIGLSAPRDFAIIGHNDTEASHFSDPPLSTVSQDFERTAVSLLRRALALAAGDETVEGESVSSILLIRETCGGKGRVTDELRKDLPNLALLEEEPRPHSPHPASMA